MRYFLAIDIGASSGRHILGHLEDGVIKLEEIYRFPNSPDREGDELIWNTDRLFGEIMTGLKRAKEMGKIPYSVAVDTWGVDYVLIGKDGKRLRHAHSYRDSARWEPAVKAVHAIIPFETLYEKTGIQSQPFNTVYQLWVDKQDGYLDRAEKLLMLPDYFHYCLTGKCSREGTEASTTGLLNAQTRDWDGEILQKLGYPQKLFPTPDESGEILGKFSPQIEKELGYSATVVLPASHDTASAVAGALAPEGELFLSSGTWSLLGLVRENAHCDEKSRLCNFTNEGQTGKKIRYLKNITGLWMVQRLRAEEAPEQSFAELTSLAERSPCDDRVNVNDARFLSPQNMKREIEEATGREMSLGECVYCALASLADCYGEAVRDLERLTGKQFSVLNILGGGSKNQLLNQMAERATGKRILTGPTEATVVGNLAVQMVSAGEISDLTEAKQIIEKSAKRGTI